MSTFSPNALNCLEPKKFCFCSSSNPLCILNGHNEAFDGKVFQQQTGTLIHLAVKSLFAERDVCVGTWQGLFELNQNSLTEPIVRWKIAMPFQGQFGTDLKIA